MSLCELDPGAQGTFDTITSTLETFNASLLLHVGDLAYAFGYEWVR